MADDATEDVALTFGEDELYTKNRRLRHPMTVVFHLVFRILSVVIYLFCGLFNISFVMTFVIIVILLSIDFWTVKNISGRLLVGLRWWNYIDEDGESHWVFESHKNKTVSSLESRIFWLALIIPPLIWIFLFVTSLATLKFQWMITVGVAISLNFANLFGYVKCKKDASKKLRNMAGTFIGQQLFKQAMSTSAEENTSKT
ncbi:Golgi apparatus membrane protein TVP23 homolog B-like [Xenia sp. Carnegie-2017]|uniref:Golgi apparatus membrane protein TVP23 homolog B-like n=1 Tax=Xenia sp. Carnegie-2017 TaxID=2897299 RepID=UPI001F0487D3|nr:Golgi apparatus membrane protein TVP23 homolog B-like [Xenia sp. Carnegie-2017]